MATLEARSAARQPASLPAWLAWQAALRPAATALRHKRLGIWHALSWQQVAHDVACLAQALADQGVAAGSSVLLLSHPRAEALLVALAAQSLGATAVPLDPLQPVPVLQALLLQLQPQFVFAQDQQQVDLLLGAGHEPALLAYADGRGLAQYRQPFLVSYAQLLASAARQSPAPVVDSKAWPSQAAFAFYRNEPGGLWHWQQFSHRQLLDDAERVIEVEKLSEREEALAARGFATESAARYLLAAWLVAGFVLNFPESLATRDTDRRELGPTLVLGTRDTYARVAAMARSRLPRHGTLLRHLLDAALAARNPMARALGYWLVRRPLREVLGFGRLRTALLVGAPLGSDTETFFQSLGVAVRTWPEAQDWQPHARRPSQPDRPSQFEAATALRSA
jgi:long-subunit acyl-CoA synthetase (AMP-forming)